MKKILSILTFLSLSFSASAQMTDDAVKQYVKEGVQQGKSQTQLKRELVVKGVTKEQVERIKKDYEAQKAAQSKVNTSSVDIERSAKEENGTISKDAEVVADSAHFENKEKIADLKKIFGRDIFNSTNLTFEPSLNVATPQNYRLGPGDQVVIEVWGASENNFSQKISPDGYINIPDVGPINLNGLTVKAASERIKAKLSTIYAGMASSRVDVSTDAKVSVGQIRTIQVNVMGEVARPGTYALSSFSTAFHALYKAGGVSGIGSLRNVKVVRGGKTISTIDVYDYILRGKSNTDIRLQEGDIVLVTPYECVVKIDGNVRRPMYYEMIKGESLKTLIAYAGGFSDDAYSRSVSIERFEGTERSIANVEEMGFSEFKLKDGDAVMVGAILDRFTNRVQIKGSVFRPGYYALGDLINSVRDLVNKADGPLEEAFLDHAILHRENPDKTLEIIPVDLKSILDGTLADIPLKKNDVLFIPSIHDLKDQGTVKIFGEVFAPGTFPYAANTKLEDLIIQAGGLKESASVVRVDVSRRMRDPKGVKKIKEIAQTFSFGVKDGFVIEGEQGFVLQPYDQVYVRMSPGYAPQINVFISGEVEFEGQYSLTERNERISDLIKKAGGLSEFAYVKGARLERELTQEEYIQTVELIRTIKQQNSSDGDSVKFDMGNIQRIYTVAIDLEKALKNPGSDYDLALREGDRIIIPQYSNTVKILGNVRMPNTVTYNSSKSLRYYINEAGGYGERTRKNGVFVLYPNGHIKKLGRFASAKKIEPGSEIIVPTKKQSQWNLSTTLSTVTSSVSMLAVVASMVNSFRK